VITAPAGRRPHDGSERPPLRCRDRVGSAASQCRHALRSAPMAASGWLIFMGDGGGELAQAVSSTRVTEARRLTCCARVERPLRPAPREPPRWTSLLNAVAEEGDVRVTRGLPLRGNVDYRPVGTAVRVDGSRENGSCAYERRDMQAPLLLSSFDSVR